MKNLISFITLLIFLHSTTNYLISTEAKISSVDDPVLDTDGDELLADTGYYIQSTCLADGGIIVSRILPQRQCIYFAVAQQGVMRDGRPLEFSPIKSQTTKAILESTDLLVSFYGQASNAACDRPWMVDEYDESTKQYFIVYGGIKGDPVQEPRRRFRIENAGDDAYKFVYCPKVDEFSVELCRPVGIFFKDGVRLLALDGDRSFTFRFKKLNHTEQLHGLELGR